MEDQRSNSLKSNIQSSVPKLITIWKLEENPLRICYFANKQLWPPPKVLWQPPFVYFFDFLIFKDVSISVWIIFGTKCWLDSVGDCLYLKEWREHMLPFFPQHFFFFLVSCHLNIVQVLKIKSQVFDWKQHIFHHWVKKAAGCVHIWIFFTHSSTESFARAHTCIFYKVDVNPSTDSEAAVETVSSWRKWSFFRCFKQWRMSKAAVSVVLSAQESCSTGSMTTSIPAAVGVRSSEALQQRCFRPARCFQTAQMMMGAKLMFFCYHGNMLAKLNASSCSS